MTANRRFVSEKVKNETVNALEQTLEAVGAEVNAVSDVVTRVVNGSKAKIEFRVSSTTEIVRGAIQGSQSAGADLQRCAKGIVIGMIRGNGLVGPEAYAAISNVAEQIVKETGDLPNQCAHSAKGAVEGAIEGAQSIGLNVDEAAHLAATGAVKAAREMSSETFDKVKKTLSGTVAGFGLVVK